MIGDLHVLLDSLQPNDECYKSDNQV